MKRHHDNFFAGYFGIEKTTELVNHKYYLDNTPKNVKFHIDSYDICQLVKMKWYTFYNELNAFRIFLKPWTKITMDFNKDLPRNKRNKRVDNKILIVISKYTKMVRSFFMNKIITAI